MAEGKRNLITYSNPDSLIAEQFRTIRTNLTFSSSGEKVRILLITSPGRGEGKSTIAANLAVLMAQQKGRVLIIDGNIRAPYLHHIFKLPNKYGLTNILLQREKTALGQLIHRTGMEKLDILTSGPTPYNAAELIAGDHMKNVIAAAKEKYDYIFIDSPAVNGVTDTQILANYSDGIIMVYRTGKTNVKAALAAKKALGMTEEKVLGVIMNRRKKLISIWG